MRQRTRRSNGGADYDVAAVVAAMNPVVAAVVVVATIHRCDNVFAAVGLCRIEVTVGSGGAA